MGIPQGSEWLLLILILVLLFGAKKLPETARGLGRSLRIFKSEVKQTDEPLDEPGGATAVPPAAIAAAPVQAVAPVQASTSIPPSSTPVQQSAPVQAPVANAAPIHVDPTSVQAVNENFYGQERSDR